MGTGGSRDSKFRLFCGRIAKREMLLLKTPVERGSLNSRMDRPVYLVCLAEHLVLIVITISWDCCVLPE